MILWLVKSVLNVGSTTLKIVKVRTASKKTIAEKRILKRRFY